VLLGTAPAAPQSPAPSGAADALCASRPDARKAHEALEQGRQAEQTGDWAAAFDAYTQATTCAPKDMEALLLRESARFRLVQQHTDRAEREALAGQLEQASDELRAALKIDPGYSVAQERLAQFESALPQAPQQGPPVLAGPVQIQPQPGKRNFDHRGDTRSAYEEIARQFGLTAAFDGDLPPRPVRFRVSGVDFETAMMLLGEQTGTFWRPVNARTFFVAQNTAEKRREYAPVVERTILLPASTTPDQMTETLRIVREIPGVTHTALDSRSRTLTLRDTPRNVALAMALLQELEQARGELMLEIEILEVNRTAARRLGITPPSSARLITLSPQDVLAFQQAQSTADLIAIILRIFGTPGSLAGLTPDQIALLLGTGHVGLGTLLPPLIAFGGGRTTFLATLPGAAADFSEALTLVRSGRRMLLRAEDGRPATFFIGERFPISLATLTASFLSALQLPANLQGALQSPYPAFQYEDLGLKVRATPRLHLDGGVTFQMEFEIRSLAGTALNGIPVISNRKVEQTVRLRENETTILSGIIQQEETRTIRGWPGLARAPEAGHLAGRRDTQQRDTELLIFLTPRLVRLAPRKDRSIYAGREGIGPIATERPRSPQ
jgi:general secretion pathway protein D